MKRLKRLRDINGTPWPTSYITMDGINFYRESGIRGVMEKATLEELKERQVVPSTFWADGRVFYIPREIHLPKGDS